MADDNRIDASPRSDFGKGAARRARRDGHVPAVLYGHGLDPVHLNLHRHQLTMALRQGLNSLLTVQVNGKDELALAKDVQVHPLQRVIQHVDLLLVKKGEKVAVDVPVELVGDVVAGGQVNHDLTSVSIEAEATDIPESISVEIDGIEVGGQVLAGDLKLPGSATLLTDPEALIIAVSEVSAVSEGDEAEEAAEGEATEEATDADDAE
ncbi:50S ribosomal protein L25/general stress protein Ctc [Cumulibacter soli]|uniref:50S ribosomal protein L25/general stress protein Ctc n=1 Tax=Cumulibacter soli TaxID=2546344 RepID=UPI0010676BBF|nr:50S ribosomal protein L25/general stress protein Ctc [Cumulibacter soli]